MAAKESGERNSPTAREEREDEEASASKTGLGGGQGRREGGREVSR
jgi:hypothetical protein